MTRIIEVELTCRACGVRAPYMVLASTNSFGDPDLDLRPAGMAREALLECLQECKRCGYCAPDISEGPDAAGEIVSSEPYRRAIAHSPGPALAGQWRRWGLISERAGDRATAGWAYLRAAWASEDADQEEAAKTYRAIALDQLTACADASVPIAEDAESQQLVRLDLLRRLGRYEEAMETANAVSESTTRDDAREVARFQSVLIQREDCRRYSVGDAKKYAASPEKWLRRRDKKDTRPWWQFWR